MKTGQNNNRIQEILEEMGYRQRTLPSIGSVVIPKSKSIGDPLTVSLSKRQNKEYYKIEEILDFETFKNRYGEGQLFICNMNDSLSIETIQKINMLSKEKLIFVCSGDFFIYEDLVIT